MTNVPTSRTIEDKRGQRVDIVPYRPEHSEEVVEMYQNFPTEHRSHGLPPILEDELVAWLRSLEANGQAFIARSDGTVTGHAAYAPKSASEPDFVVFVAPAYQNRGIGTALLCHVVRNTAAENFDGIVSYVDRDNDSAIHVYEKCGFEETDREPLVVQMRLDLDDAAIDALPTLDADDDATRRRG
jgi:GNAT superfamily N-acetyltransferase